MIVLAHRAQEIAGEVPVRCGVEVDVRDVEGMVRLGHDPIGPYGWSSQTHLAHWLVDEERPVCAINVKADGLLAQIQQIAHDFQAACPWFVFDMSMPQLVQAHRMGIPYVMRSSEYDIIPPVQDLRPSAIWADRFTWPDDPAHLTGHLQRVTWQGRRQGGIPIYAVSPELHAPDCPMDYIEAYWSLLAAWGVDGVCTDHWDRALTYFGVTLDDNRSTT